MRDDSARPSRSRTVGATTISPGRSRSAREATHDGHLLRVLAPEPRAVGAHAQEELRHDGGDAAEVARARGPLEALRDPAHVDVGREALGVEVVPRGRVDGVHALAGEQVEVGVERARIAREVLARPELERVHEDADHHRVARGPRATHEGRVALVEGAHGGHEAHGPLDSRAEHLERAAVVEHDGQAGRRGAAGARGARPPAARRTPGRARPQARRVHEDRRARPRDERPRARRRPTARG